MVNRKTHLESKASFIDISSIALFKLVLIAWLREYCTFSDSLWLASPGLGQNTSRRGLFSKKNHVLLSNFFSSSKMFFIRLFLANIYKKFGGHRARLREKENLFPHVRALMTRKSCAVEMHNVILRNYLKQSNPLRNDHLGHHRKWPLCGGGGVI